MSSIIPTGKSSKSRIIQIMAIAALEIAIKLASCIATGDDTPQLNDLLTYIVEQYAVYWERLGLKLGLKDYQLANISENNTSRQSRQVETCCKTVLQKWLQIDSSPTWGKLDDVIVSLTTAPLQFTSHKGTVT